MDAKDKLALAVELAKFDVLREILNVLRRQGGTYSPPSDSNLKTTNELLQDYLKRVDELLGS